MTIDRARYRCLATGAMEFPLDELLDLPGGEVTASLARRALRLSTTQSFAELQEELLAQHDVRLTDSTLDTLMQRVGTVAEADRQKVLEELEQMPRGMYREQKLDKPPSAPARLYISCDGITYRTCHREPDPDHPGEKRVIYQEMKVGCVFWQDAKGRWCKRVVAGRDDVERFGLDLWSVAVECGMLDCEDVVFISDGGVWCDSVARLYFQDALRILDWYHLSEHVWQTGRKLYPNDPAKAEGWVDHCLDALYSCSGAGLLRHLERSNRARGGDSENVEELMNYVRPRLRLTDYVDYRNGDYVIGSGMMESTCKQVVGRRLKGVGMLWSEEGAVAMVNLVRHRLNNTWDEFWAGRPLQRAA